MAKELCLVELTKIGTRHLIIIQFVTIGTQTPIASKCINTSLLTPMYAHGAFINICKMSMLSRIKR